MRQSFSVKKIIKIICLLVMVGILCVIPRTDVKAASLDSTLAGETEERTNITEPGSSDSRDDLSELNIANSLTISLNNGNGQMNGTLRILITLTMIGQNYHCSSFYKGGFKYPNGTSQSGVDWVSFVFNLFHHAAHADAGL